MHNMETVTQHSTKRFTVVQILEGLEGVLIMLACYITLFLKPLRDRWGLSKAESLRELPGDHLVKKPRSHFSHGIKINAPVEYVWPWVAQMGKDRGGFYSYEALENIAGLGIYNSETILGEFQDPKVGDIIPFGPDGGSPLVICEKGRAMVIEHCDDLDKKSTSDPVKGSSKNFLHLSWLWYIESIDEGFTRFISRNRVNYNPSIKNRIIFKFLAEPIIFAMDRKMCLGIKKRSERMYRNAADGLTLQKELAEDKLL